MRRLTALVICFSALLMVQTSSAAPPDANALYNEGLHMMGAIEQGLRSGQYAQKQLTPAKRKQITAIEEKFLAALKAAPNHGRAHIMIGMLYKFTEQYDKAIPHLKSGMKLPKKSADWIKAADTLGSVYMKQNKARPAIKVFEQIIRVYPKDSMALYKLGVCYWSSHKNRKAKKVLKKVVALNNGFVQEAKNILAQIK